MPGPIAAPWVLRATVTKIDKSKRLLASIARKERIVLIRTGQFGRTAMKRLIRRRKKFRKHVARDGWGTRREYGVSKPGNPPHAHAKGASGLKDVRYWADKNRDAPASVIIGHEKYKWRRARTGTSPITGEPIDIQYTSIKPVPQLLNEGGQGTRHVKTASYRGTVPLHYRPRPFRAKAMAPTMKFFLARMKKERLR